MLSVEQIRQLENKVGEFVERYQRLRADNLSLRERLEGYQQRIDELERRLKTVSDDQAAITEGLTAAIRSLEALEETGEIPGASDQKEAGPTGELQPQAGSEPVFVEIGEEELDAGEMGSETAASMNEATDDPVAGTEAEVQPEPSTSDVPAEAETQDEDEDSGDPELEIF